MAIKWFDFSDCEPSDDRGDFFIVRGNMVCNGDEFAEIAFWSGASFMSIGSEGDCFEGPIKGIREWRPLEA